MRIAIHTVVVCLLVFYASSAARTPGVVVQGTITDVAGAALPGVSVELLKNGQVVATAVTDSRGGFRQRALYGALEARLSWATRRLTVACARPRWNGTLVTTTLGLNSSAPLISSACWL